jgi:hypothetical protein
MQLEDENSKLKRIVADLSLDKEMLQELALQPEALAPPTSSPLQSTVLSGHVAGVEGGAVSIVQAELYEYDECRRQ